MVLIVTTMAVIVIAGAGVLGFAYTMNVLSRSRTARARLRRRAFAVAAACYRLRRTLGHRLHRAALRWRQRRDNRPGSRPDSPLTGR